MSDINISVFENSTEITIQHNNVDVTLQNVHIDITLSSCLPPTPDQIIDALNSLDEYNNEESAIADGVGLHGLYWASESTDSLIAGGLYRVTSV
jgi:coenzyme F420-reducing hydrogenase gamma subunit